MHRAHRYPLLGNGSSRRTLEDTSKGNSANLLADAQGVAIIPHVVKAGFIVAGSGGHGLVIARNKEGQWGKPVFINLGGGSVGFQAGVESTDVVLIFRQRKSLDRFIEGKGKITLGADASIAAGPVGRQATAGTDAKLEAEIVSYSRSRGLFAGCCTGWHSHQSGCEFERQFRC